jgi:hypothetical protein
VKFVDVPGHGCVIAGEHVSFRIFDAEICSHGADPPQLGSPGSGPKFHDGRCVPRGRGLAALPHAVGDQICDPAGGDYGLCTNHAVTRYAVA